jgi:nicotinamide-nucleotide amidase
MPDRTRVQALIPEGALVLANAYGTAPGLAMKVEPNPFRGEGSSWLIMLPGPPRELRPMFTEMVVPLLREVFPASPLLVCRNFRTIGIGESLVQEKIGSALEPFEQAGLMVGYCARPGQVDVRLAATGERGNGMLMEAEAIVQQALSKYIFATGGDELEEVIIRQLTERNQTLALAESCTGGYLAHRLTNVPGASKVLLAGLVTYSNQAKEKFLGVRAQTLAEHGAVSEPVAREMAEGARAQTGADFALSVTGIAGPGGGTPSKPVGTVFIGLAGSLGSTVEQRLNPLDRETFKQVTVEQAMEMLRRAMI